MKYNGISWVPVGSAGISADSTFSTSITIDRNGIPYVAYNSNDGATVQQYRGGSWGIVGNAGFSPGFAGYTFIAAGNNDTPYVAYADYGNSGKASVMKYNGSTGVKNNFIVDNGLSIFPNPTHNSFSLHISSPQSEEAAITITNMLGEKVNEFVSYTNTDIEIQLNEPRGVYFINAVVKEGSVTSKVLLE